MRKIFSILFLLSFTIAVGQSVTADSFKLLSKPEFTYSTIVVVKEINNQYVGFSCLLDSLNIYKREIEVFVWNSNLSLITHKKVSMPFKNLFVYDFYLINNSYYLLGSL